MPSGRVDMLASGLADSYAELLTRTREIQLCHTFKQCKDGLSKTLFTAWLTSQTALKVAG